MADKWKKIENEFWKPEKEGQELIGKVCGSEETLYGKATKLVDDTGKAYLLNFTALKLDSLDNERVKIVFVGEKVSENSGRKYKAFDVFKAMD